MRFRTKLLLFIIPLILLPIVIVTVIFIQNTTENVSTLQFELMATRLQTIEGRGRSEHDILTRLNLEGSPFYVRSAQQKLFDLIEGTHVPGGFIYVTDSQGEIVYYPKERAISDGIVSANNAHFRTNSLPNSPHQFNLAQRSYISFHTRLEEWDWVIVVVSEEEVIYAGINTAVRTTITSGTVVAIIGISLLYLISQSISKPIELLIDESRKLSEGHLDARVDIRSGDEFQELGQAFNEMAQRLDQNFKHIEDQMREIQTVTNELKESESTLKGVFNQAFQLVGLIDRNGLFIEINDTGVQFVGTPRDQMIGKPIWETPFWNHSPSEKYVIQRFIDRALTGELVRQELLYQGKVNLDFSIKPVFDGQGHVVKMIVEARDITVLKHKERELEILNEELEGRIVHRTRELTTTNEELLRTKDELEYSIGTLKQTQEQLIESEKLASLGSVVAGISHEVNTPLGIAVTLVSHIHQEIRDIVEANEDRRLTKSAFTTFLDTMKEESDLTLKNLKHASELISGFKMIAVDQSSHEMRRFELNGYLHEILNTLHPQLKKTSHEVLIECPEDIYMDSYPGALFQILSNLIMNTLIHGFYELENGLITIHVTELESRVQIVYEDNGRGIPPEDLSRIFQPFYTTARGRGSSGLGLHIVYNLAHNVLMGDLTCHSVVGNGVMFNMTIPKKVDGFVL